MKNRLVMILSVFVSCLLVIPAVVAQSLVSGDLTGTVSDQSGALVANATVLLRSIESGESHTMLTTSSGSYRFSLLRPGTYTLTVTAQGFRRLETKVIVNLGQATVSDLHLALGASTETVEVTGTAPLVNTDNADLSTTIDESFIANQPNGGNDLTYVAQTTPGIVMNAGMGGAGGMGNFTSNGLPGTANLFTVNGENDMDPYLNLNNSGATNLTLGRNELQEATVITNPYSGQYGQQAGAQVTYITKSGGNEFHGNLIYWWTGRAMDANDWFNNNSHTPRPFANNNEWAASFGGPIRKDKTFFFADFEGIRYIVPSTQPVFAFSPAFAADTLASLATASPASIPTYTKLFNLYQGAAGYANGHPFAGNCADYTGPASTIGTFGDCIRQFEGAPALPGTEFILAGRVDHNFSDNDRVFWRVRMDHGTQDTAADPINSAFSAASYQPAYDGQSQWNHIFSANATNQFIMAGSYYRAIFTQENAKATFPASVEGDAFNLTTLGGNSFAFPQGRNVTQYQFVDDFTYTKGNHSMRVGANFRRYDISDFVFSEYNTPRVISLSLTDFSQGQADEYIQRFPQKLVQPIALWGLGAYGQDEWKANAHLKLTVGLRVEHNSNPVCQTNCAALAVQPAQFLSTDVNTPYNQLIQSGRHQIFRSMDAINLSPRLGFAWSPLGEHTVVRGGGGIFYDALPAVMGDQFMLNVPEVLSFTLINSAVGGSLNNLLWADPSSTGAPALAASSAAALSAGFNSGANYPQLAAQVPGFARPTLRNAGTFHSAQYQQWSFGVDQSIGAKSSLSVMYVGNHGIHIPIYNQGLNAHIAGGLSPIPASRVFPMFGTVEQYDTVAVSNHNGLVSSFKRRMTYGLTVQASYMWSHTLDEVSNGGILGANAGSILPQLNPYNIRQGYGPADYDIRNNFTASYVWATPWKFANRFANNALGGWVFSQNFFVQSGPPFTVQDGTTSIPNLNATNTPPAQVIASDGQRSCLNGHSQCLNINAFESAAAYGAFPTQHRNGFRGPGFFDSDFNVNKNFKLTERMTLALGANFYNVFNHPNFSIPDGNIADSTFGQILTTTAPPTGPYGSFFTGLPSGRIVQFQGKFTF